MELLYSFYLFCESASSLCGFTQSWHFKLLRNSPVRSSYPFQATQRVSPFPSAPAALRGTVAGAKATAATVFRSGDLVRLTQHSALQCLGRMDHQVLRRWSVETCHELLPLATYPEYHGNTMECHTACSKSTNLFCKKCAKLRRWKSVASVWSSEKLKAS